MQNQTSFLVDGISSIAIHNGVVRVQFMRLGMDGKPQPTVELHIPVTSIKSVMEALGKASR
ncbi:MAG: hypothetical protein A2511_17525 [Deltaproteobacteria bacterium RIFOXYD12_FULL_50_9]|nr:MAG: hypothetical protein A2511_17525 [Deltaproteobacteria bacterium RIFOXYD12_FULL_50_9]